LLILCSAFVSLPKINTAKAEAKTIVVPDDYSTIGWAVGNATEGDTIYVKSGIYPENLQINKSLSLVGEDREATIIDGGKVDTVLKITSDGVNVTGFTIRNSGSDVVYHWFSKIGAGIHLSSARYCNIVGNNIAANYWGIYIESSSNNSIVGNIIANNERGTQLSSSTNNTVRDNKMADNDYNFGVSGGNLSHFINDVDISNTINGKPIYYLTDEKDLVISPSTFPDLGFLALVNCTNITVQNLTLANNGQGILLAYTTNSIITHNNLTSNQNGIFLDHSNGNQVYRNMIVSNGAGIYLNQASCNNLVSDNTINNSGTGAVLTYSSDRNTIEGNEIIGYGTAIVVSQNASYNTVTGNNIVGSYDGYSRGGLQYGVELKLASSIIITGNNVTGNFRGIEIHSSNNVTLGNNTIASNRLVGGKVGFGDQAYGVHLVNCGDCKFFDNTIESNLIGISLWYCLNFTLSGNVLRDNNCGFMIEGMPSVEYYLHRIDNLNTVNSKPVYYLVNQHDIQVPSNAGWAAAVNCTNITIENLAPAPNGDGLTFVCTKDSRIVNSTLSGSFNAIVLRESSNCTISRNLICNSGYAAIYFDHTVDCTVTENDVVNNFCILGMRHASERNILFHNNFVNNSWIGAFDQGQNTWDNGSEGNYWNSYDQRASYMGLDSNGDGIGDTPYVIDSDSNNIDRYPLMAPFNTSNAILEFPLFLILALFMIATLLVIVIKKKIVEP
jgi:parallel beta-helix repeat protein